LLEAGTHTHVNSHSHPYPHTHTLLLSDDDRLRHIYEINSGTHNFITLDNYNEFELIIFGIGEDFDDVRLLESNLCRQYKSYLTEGGCHAR
jgi:hypothetical protein